ncbi:MAG: ABC transporter permease [Proteobacteria bacterium]|jgi:phospholipid/cholesterol/gamma-HCH transport system permease protein|nr:ABC transporter permease [Alphaproteobacteria bacterium]NCC03252.1 ABC transporter permease [Pseudomonadota bacterium]
MDFLTPIGRTFLGFLQVTGQFALFAARTFSHMLRPPFYWAQIFRQMIDIGYYSLPVVGLTALFTGMVLALQSHSGFSRFDAETAIPTVVILSITRELGPVMAGLMVAGRIGAAIAAELGTMRVTEQIDALTTLSTNPYKYLIVPRMLAATITMPILVLVADIVGVFGGFLVSVYRLNFNASNYISQSWEYLEFSDVTSGLWKAASFGLIIALMGSYNGFNSKGGAQGVGTATTNAVVSASILILVTNYILTGILFASN